MTNPEVALLMLGLFIVLVLLGFPIAFTLLAMGVGFGYYAYHQGHPIETFTDIFNNNIFYLLNQNTYSVMEESHAGGHPAVSVHGICGGTGQHRRQTVLLPLHGRAQPARQPGDCCASHLRGVLDSFRDRRSRGDADGPSGVPGHGQRQL